MTYKRMKHIETDLQIIADDTGYSYQFLADRVNELVNDGESFEAAVDHVRSVSYEKDW